MEKEKRKVLMLKIPKSVHKDLKEKVSDRGMNIHIMDAIKANKDTLCREEIQNILHCNSDTTTVPYRLFMNEKDHKDLKTKSVVDDFNMRDFAVAAIIKSLK